MIQTTMSSGAPAASTLTAPTASTGTAASSGEYRPVEGGNPTQSGEALLVEAYILVWAILMAWLVLLWRKQAQMHARIDDLEKILDAADKASSGSGAGASSNKT